MSADLSRRARTAHGKLLLDHTSETRVKKVSWAWPPGMWSVAACRSFATVCGEE
jgi:hypothetical protein